jgi:hypothetical protein
LLASIAVAGCSTRFVLHLERNRKGYRTSPGSKTPEATLAAAIGTEINKKSDASRFARPEPGKFTLR